MRLFLSLAVALAAVPLEGGECTFVLASPVAFGRYDVFARAPLDATGTVRYRCTAQAAPPRITLSQGGAGILSKRWMENGGDRLEYDLYLDAARTSVWSDGSGAHYAGPPAADGEAVTLTVYGRIPGRQDVGPGSYRDTILVTVHF